MIEAALNDPDPNNPVVIAIAARLEALTAILKETTERQQALPHEITIGRPATALDAVVIELFCKTLADLPGAPKLRVLDYGRQ